MIPATGKSKERETEMEEKVVRIERIAPRDGAVEEPALTTKGYVLGDPRFGKEKHHANNAIFVRTLDVVAVLVGQGYSLRMKAPGKRESLVSPGMLQIVRKGVTA